jgi:hypothetical protein
MVDDLPDNMAGVKRIGFTGWLNRNSNMNAYNLNSGIIST